MENCIDVAVVGAGLVGTALALGLSQRGFDVELIERAPFLPGHDDDYDLRVYAIAPSAAAFLERLGVWPQVLAQRASAYTQMQVWERERASALSFSAAELPAPALGHIVENSLLQRVLWHALPAGVLRNALAVQSAQSEGGVVRLQLSDGEELYARLLVVAEGRDSALRAQLGIEMLSGVYAQMAVVCHVQTEQPHQGVAYQRFMPTGPLAFLPLADGRSSIVWSSSEAEALLALDEEDFRRVLGEASQQVLGRIQTCTRRVRFPLALQHAERYVAERAVLVGDAAHLVHPLAGQGVNLGFGDVEALIGLLAEARDAGRDFGAERLLKRYERARRADVLDMIAVTDGLYRAYQLPLPGLASLREVGLGLVKAAAPLRRELVRRAVGLR
ncbi:2-octaprenylphenol hydroxylase [Solimonas aquatica]|uniref:2-octaprenylphenol hydroxylase n=1 Tax=Solimonas aquatica TaxID=489703 RepID=A0A1H9CEY1_9GAMM|nr:UbiH/UbiF/VisC/COQ6 family ubiquinone biosynthesis hydroxylase [Solimonas aquatica]SEP99208.1 2-octaprenylphenol hydroxylase [Solimonas aquatica]